MNPIHQAYQKLNAAHRKASIAQIGGFRPPENKISSWFGGPGVGLEGEKLPQYKGKNMFCLLQIKVNELPYVPPELLGIAFLLVFFNREVHPFDQPHGDGWLIRSYKSLDGLRLLPETHEPKVVKEFPIQWSLVTDDAPGWENAWDIVDMNPINDTEDGSDRFYEAYNRYQKTKMGGFPYEIQHGADLEGYVFQIGTEEKANWMWADNGVAYFNINKSGEWVFGCQFY